MQTGQDHILCSFCHVIISCEIHRADDRPSFKQLAEAMKRLSPRLPPSSQSQQLVPPVRHRQHSSPGNPSYPPRSPSSAHSHVPFNWNNMFIFLFGCTNSNVIICIYTQLKKFFLTFCTCNKVFILWSFQNKIFWEWKF